MDDVDMPLTDLQHLIKKDPDSYKNEFTVHFNNFRKQYSLQYLCMSDKNTSFCLLLNFLGHTVHLYRKCAKKFLKILMEIIENHPDQINAEIRLSVCKILFRFKNLPSIDIYRMYTQIIQQFDCHDKVLRGSIFNLLVSDLRRGCGKAFTHAVKEKLQAFLYKKISDNSESLNIQYASICILCELWRRNVWRDDRVANAISTAAFSPHYRVSYLSLLFMNGKYPRIKEINTDDIDNQDIERLQFEMNREFKRSRVHGSSRSTKRKQRKLMASIKKSNKQTTSNDENEGDTSIIRMLYNSQDFMDKLFTYIIKSKHKFEYKLLGLSVVSRIIAVHGLFLPNFYEFCLKYLHPHQTHVMKVLTCIIQACHCLVSAETIKPIVDKIAANFVSLQNSCEICSVGINSIREIYYRIPLAIDPIIAVDLINYAHDRKAEKAVVSAARSLLNCLREVNPHVLPKKFKNSVSSNVPELHYGSVEICNTVPGAEFLNADTLNELSDSGDESSTSEIDFEDKEICTKKILSDRDFRRLRVLKNKHKSMGDQALLSASDSEERDKGDSVIVDSALISSSHKRNLKEEKHEKNKFNPHKGWRFNTKASSTNAEKRKNKAFNMVKYKSSIKNKKTRSYVQRVASLKRALKRKQKAKV